MKKAARFSLQNPKKFHFSKWVPVFYRFSESKKKTGVDVGVSVGVRSIPGRRQI